MGHYVEDGVLDAGITGQDWVQEYGFRCCGDIRAFVCPWRFRTSPLGCGGYREDSDITEISQLEGKRIATELVGYSERYFNERGNQR